ncbi:MAG: HAMP domain-containing histidine kinase [Deltaproteobacteria bacterium]|nr:HAMP domain-containing histidine kinase [Deltaproteobacteria bacterium]MBW1834477.1 HAMP domain-containing histidine kinase [Deltaproteobacteria bacterium]MBW2164848.1 HAMP domain-containing histidine kinase [Deltaproteobacteria bacterium]
MKLRFGIISKLLVGFFIPVIIFYVTIILLYMDVQKIVDISEGIITKNTRISLISKKMIENLIRMEENDKKYHLLKKDDYFNYFVLAQKEFEGNFVEILELERSGMEIPREWRQLYKSYQDFSTTFENLRENKSSGSLWIHEAVTNEWIQIISELRAKNEHDIALATMALNSRSQKSARNVLVGLMLSSVVGLFVILFLAYSMIRPLRELLRGIRSVSQDRISKTVNIRSKDEFGELAGAFNDMTLRLREEECMRSDFISMLSHEIRTPLTSIRESVNMIVEEVMGTINNRQRKFLEIASIEIGRICNLLNHLMQVSRLESQTIEIMALPLDISSFITGCIYQLQPLADTKKISVEAQIAPDIPGMTGDLEHLQRVIINLLNNAIKFSDPGSRVVLRVVPNKNRTMLDFSVSDNGPGIPKEEQSLIFNKYYRARGVRDHMDGVGLGLHISKNIVEFHKGTIWVKSTVGHGSTFGFTLPAS